MSKMFGYPPDFGCVSYSESIASQVLLCTSVFGVNTRDWIHIENFPVVLTTI